ncbi:MAG: hypothetical protein ABF586_00440 [Sporolactobacillus sp.]
MMQPLMKWKNDGATLIQAWLLAYWSLALLAPDNALERIGYVSLLALVHAAYLIIIHRLNQLNQATRIIGGVLVATAALLFAHFNLISAVVLCLIVLFFITPDHNRRDRFWLIFTLTIGLIAIHLLSGTSSQAFFIAAASLLISWFLALITAIDRRSQKMMFAAFGFLPLIAAVLAILLASIRPFFQTVCAFLYWHLLGRGIGWFYQLLSTLLNHGSDARHAPSRSIEHLLKQSTPSANASHLPMQAHGDSLIQQFGWLILLIILGLVVGFIYAKYRRQHWNSSFLELRALNVESLETVKQIDAAKPALFNQLFSPSNSIRRAVWRLLRFADKAGKGRASGQTLAEWAKSLSIGDREPAWVTVYQCVRYGLREPTHAEKQLFFDSITETKKKLKQ